MRTIKHTFYNVIFEIMPTQPSYINLKVAHIIAEEKCIAIDFN